MAKVTLTIPMYDREWSHWWAAEELGDPLTIIWVRVGHRRARMSKMTTMMPTATEETRALRAGETRDVDWLSGRAFDFANSRAVGFTGVIAVRCGCWFGGGFFGIGESDSGGESVSSQVARQASC